MADLDPQPATGTQTRAWWLHPFLVAAFPVLFLFAQNIREQITLQPLWTPLGVVVAGGAAVLVLALILGRVLDVGVGRSALAASLLIGLALTYGHAWNLVGDAVRLHRYLLIAWTGLALAGLFVIYRLRPPVVARVTTALNVLVGVLLVINLVPIGDFALRAAAADEPAGVSNLSSQDPVPDRQRDVWYIVPDRYAGSRGLREGFGFDNGPFLDALRERGFEVAEEATATYLKTALSLASSLNMTELDADQLASEASATDDWAPVYRRLQGNHAVGRFLRERGYEYLHVGSRRGPTSTNATADATFLLGRTEFDAVLADTTILAALKRVLPAQVPVGIEGIISAQTEFQFGLLNQLADKPGPNFVFVHMLVPHPPYAFNADGSRVTDAQRASRTVDEQYLEQLKFTNASFLSLVDRLHDRPTSEWPIIVLAADEGPFPPRYVEDEERFKWLEATPDELLRKFSILTAISVPGVDRAGLETAGFTDDLTPVNLFRVVFNAAFDAELPMLPQRNFVFVDQRHLYDQVEVTDRLQP
jgi:hypothetical protein